MAEGQYQLSTIRILAVSEVINSIPLLRIFLYVNCRLN
jgi:hypothetical protein